MARGAGGPSVSSSVAVTSVEQLAAVITDANRSKSPLRVAAGAHWLDAGRPVDAGQQVDLATLQGVVEYTPGDLTLTALSGTSLTDLDAATRAHGQWITLDPHGSRSGTLGATLATASSGPLAASFGTPRDIALGLTFVNGEGEVIRAGGRVVKNVAGFDLVRLLIGAWGTLGVLTEATVRVRAVPAMDLTVHAVVPSGRAELAERLRAYRDAPTTPLAIQLVNGTLSHAIGLGRNPLLLVRLAGNAASVAAQRDILHRIASLEDAPSDVWSKLAEWNDAGCRTLRISTRPSELSGLWLEVVHQLGSDGVALSAVVTRGTIRVAAPPGHDQALRAMIASLPVGTSVVLERVPNDLWTAQHRPADVLSRRVRQAFDPNRILNRGILGLDEGAAS